MTGKSEENNNKNEARFWSIPALFLQQFGMLGVFALTMTMLFMSPWLIRWFL